MIIIIIIIVIIIMMFIVRPILCRLYGILRIYSCTIIYQTAAAVLNCRADAAASC